MDVGSSWEGGEGVDVGSAWEGGEGGRSVEVGSALHAHGSWRAGVGAGSGADGFGSPIEVSSAESRHYDLDGNGNGTGVSLTSDSDGNRPPPPPPPPGLTPVTAAAAAADTAAAARLLMNAQLSTSCDSLKILCEYHALALPALGEDLVFAPLDALKPITFTRRVPEESWAAAGVGLTSGVVGAAGAAGAAGPASRATVAGTETSGWKKVAGARMSGELSGSRSSGGGGVGMSAGTYGAANGGRPSSPDDDTQQDLTEPTWRSPSVVRTKSHTGAGEGADAGGGAGAEVGTVACVGAGSATGKHPQSQSQFQLPPPGCVVTPAEEAAHLETWTVAALCRCLSLDNVLMVLNGALLERQLVVLCPNLGRVAF